MVFRSAFKVTLFISVLSCSAYISATRAEAKDITLPMLEVPDDLGTSGHAVRKPDRSALLRDSVQLSNMDDRRTSEREQASWRRLSGSVCSNCDGTQRVRKVDYVDPVAVLNAKVATFRQTVLASRAVQPSRDNPTDVLNAKVAAWRQTVLASRAVQPSRNHRVRLTHRRRHKSTLYAYYSRFRYTLLKWRKQHRHRVRLVQR